MERNNSSLGKQEALKTQLLVEGENDDNRVNSAVTPLLLFSIFIAVSGAFAYGCAIGYSSPVESAIIEDLGLTTAQVPIYIAEITPYNLRGGLVSLVPVMISTGILVVFFIGSLIPWRILVLVGIFPSLVQLLGVFFIPESPRFLAKHCQNDAYIMVLQRLRGNNIDISKEATNIEEFTESIRNITEVNFFGLLKRKYAYALVVALGLMALSGLGGPVAVIYYASSIFESVGFSSSIGSVVLAVVQLPTTILSAFMIDKYGRRPLLMISASAMSFCCFLVGVMFLFKENNLLEHISPYFLVVGLWGYTATYCIGMSGIPYVIMSEVFSMDVKGSGGSLSAVVSSGSSWISSYTFNFLTGWSFPGAFFVLASINSFAALFIVKLVPETNGKTLEEIQESFQKRPWL